MDKVTNFLKHLDLSDGETKVYLTLLKTEALSIRELASKTGIKGTTAYLYIDQLIEKGLIIKLVKGSRKLVSATEPKENLSLLTEKKLRTAKTMQTELPDMLKIITASVSPAIDNTEAEIKYYKGRNGVKKIYEEALKAKELRTYVDMTKIAEVFPDNFKLFNNGFNSNPAIKIFEIVENSAQARQYLENFKEKNRYFYKIFPEDMRLIAQDILIYDNKVAIIYLKDAISGIVLHNTDLYNNFKLLFDFMWKMLPNEHNSK